MDITLRIFLILCHGTVDIKMTSGQGLFGTYYKIIIAGILVHGEYLIILYFICVEKYDLAESTFGYWSRKAQQLPSKKVCNIFKLKLFDLKKIELSLYCKNFFRSK